MKKTALTALVIAFPLFFTGIAQGNPTPEEPARPAQSIVAGQAGTAPPSGPLGSTFEVYSDGDMAMTVNPSATALPPRANGDPVYAYEVTAEQLSGNPYVAGGTELTMVTTDGERIYSLYGLPGEMESGFLEPGEIRSGVVAFSPQKGQTPSAIIFASIMNDLVQSAWIL